jgi:hypothetical protein
VRIGKLINGVSNSKIKTSIDQMSEDERFLAAAYLQRLSQERDRAYGQVLAERLTSTNEGRKVSLEQVRRIHDALENEGL